MLPNHGRKIQFGILILSMLARIIWGLVVTLFGLLLLLRSRWFIDFLGTFDFLEYKIGPGGTQLTYKLVGTFMVVIGFLVMTNLWQAFLQATLGSLLPQPRVGPR